MKQFCPDRVRMTSNDALLPMPLGADFYECPTDCPGPSTEQVTFFGGRLKLWSVQVCPLSVESSAANVATTFTEPEAL